MRRVRREDDEDESERKTRARMQRATEHRWGRRDSERHKTVGDRLFKYLLIAAVLEIAVQWPPWFGSELWGWGELARALLQPIAHVSRIWGRAKSSGYWSRQSSGIYTWLGGNSCGCRTVEAKTLKCMLKLTQSQGPQCPITNTLFVELGLSKTETQKSREHKALLT